MKEFAAFVRKEFYHIYRDKRTMLVLIGIPILLITIFGFALSVEIKNVNIGILCPQNEECIKHLIEKIGENEYFTITAQLHNPSEVDKLMRQGKTDVIIEFSNHFSKQMQTPDGASISIIADASDPNISKTEVMYLQSIIQDYFNGTIQTDTRPRLTTNIRMLYNPQLKSSFNFVPGIMGLILILICALMTSVSIVREKETGTMEILLASPVKPLTIIIAKMVPYLAISCIILAIIFILSSTLLQVPITGSLFWLIVISLLYILLSLSIGLLVSTLVKTQMAATLITAVLFMMPVMMLSGMTFPIENMPLFFQWISTIIPARWYISAVRKVMIEGLSIENETKEIAILASMTLAILTLALKKFNDRLE
jgi:ABC-2 type transport system permease protein